MHKEMRWRGNSEVVSHLLWGLQVVSNAVQRRRRLSAFTSEGGSCERSYALSRYLSLSHPTDEPRSLGPTRCRLRRF